MLRHASSLSGDRFPLNVSSRVKSLAMSPGGAVRRTPISCGLYSGRFLQKHTQEGHVSRKTCLVRKDVMASDDAHDGEDTTTKKAG